MCNKIRGPNLLVKSFDSLMQLRQEPQSSEKESSIVWKVRTSSCSTQIIQPTLQHCLLKMPVMKQFSAYMDFDSWKDR